MKWHAGIIPHQGRVLKQEFPIGPDFARMTAFHEAVGGVRGKSGGEQPHPELAGPRLIPIL